MNFRINNYYFLILSVFIFFFSSCQEQRKVENIEPVVDSYLEVWNTGNLNSLDSIVTQNFELRINPTFKPLVGIDSLKKAIMNTRNMFPDFNVIIDQKILTGDTILVATWTIEGTYSGGKNLPMESKKISTPGFSVIFFSNNMITGEWIAYSDLTLTKQLGFSLVPPKESKK